MGFLQALQAVSVILPLARDAVQIAEAMFGPGRGTEKLAAAVNQVQAALPKAGEFAAHADALAAVVKPVVESVVAAANASGHFKKSKQAAKPTVRTAAAVPSAAQLEAEQDAARLAAARARALKYGPAIVSRPPIAEQPGA